MTGVSCFLRQEVWATRISIAQLALDATVEPLEGATERPAAGAVEEEVDREVDVIEHLDEMLTQRYVSR